MTKTTTKSTTTTKAAKVEKTAGKSTKSTKTVKPKVEKVAKTEKPKVEKAEHVEEPEKPENVEEPVNVEKPSKKSKVAKTEKTEKTEKTAKSTKTTKTKASKATSTPKSGSQPKAQEKRDAVIPEGTKLPEPPKAKLNAYTYFVADRRPKLRAKNPEWEFAVLTRKVAGEWKALSAEKKKKYEDQAAEDAERHKVDMEKWEASCREAGYEPSDVRKHFKTQKDKKNLPKGPVRCRTPYAFFMMNMHKELSTAEMTFKERTQKMASAWKALSDAEKQPYVDQSKADKSRYEGALESFLEENPEVAKNNKRKRKRLEGEPKRAKTAYIFFTIESRDRVKNENPEMKTTEILKELGKQWKTLNDSKKSKYEEMAKNDSARYKQEKETWDAKAK